MIVEGIIAYLFASKNLLHRLVIAHLINRLNI